MKQDDINTKKDIKPELNELGKYFDTFDERTGLRFNIPMLSTIDPEYFFKYVRFMKMKERSPETFEKVLNWD